MNKSKRIGRMALCLIVSFVMIMTLIPRLPAGLAFADETETVDGKNLIDNENGTYKLSLEVTGDADTTSATANANILVIYDVSGSMESNTTVYNPATGTGGTQYGYYNNEYVRIYYNNGTWYRTRTGNQYTGYNYSNPYDGPRYTQATVSKGAATEKVVYEFADALFEYNKNPGDKNVEMALVTFSGPGRQDATTSDNDATLVQGWTNNQNNEFLNRLSNTGNTTKLSYGGGTDWEAAMRRALIALGSADSDPTYVVFVTDGAPTFRRTSQTGSSYNPYGHGTTTTDDINNYRATLDEVLNIGNYNTADHSYTNPDNSNTEMYGIYAYGTEGDFLDDLIYYAHNGKERPQSEGGVTTATVNTPYYYNANNSAAVNAAIEEIFSAIAETLGIGSASITDGTTSRVETTTGEISHLLEVDDTSFEYWLTIPVTASGNNFTTIRKDLLSGEDYTITFADNGDGTYTATWTDPRGNSHTATYEGTLDGTVGNRALKLKWTEPTDLYNFEPPEATFNSGSGSVDWNLSGLGTLLDDVTYTVTFDVYPSQYTYDTIAKMENGELDWDDLDDNEKLYLLEDGSLRTNTTGGYKYTDTRDENPQEQSFTYKNPDPVPTTASKMKIVKTWDNSIDDIQKEALDMNINQDGSYYGKVPLNDGNNYTNTYYIAVGLLTTGTDTNGNVTVKTLDPGHDYVMTEPVGLAYNWDLIAETVHPMLIDGVLNTLVKVDKPSGMTGDYYKDSSNKEYYHLVYKGKDYGYYQITKAGDAEVTAYNQRRNSLILNKVVEDNGFDIPEDTTFEFKMKVDNKIGTGDDEDVWFSIHSSEEYVQSNMVYDLEHTKVSGAEAEALTIDTTQTDTVAASNVVGDDGDHLTYRYGDSEYTVKIASGPAADGSYTYYVYEIIGQEGDEVTYTRYGVEYTAPYAGKEGDFYKYYTGYYHAPNGSEITVKLEAGEFVRFVNLPIGTEYSFTETAPSGDFEYDSAKAEIKTGAASSYSTDSNATIDNSARKVSGTLPTGNSFYKTTYTNNMDKVDITATKVWEDNDDQDGLRTAVTLHLNKSVDGGTPTVVTGQDKTIPKGATGDALTVTWEDLSTVENGKTVTYSITEDEIDGYTTEITKDESPALTSVPDSKALSMPLKAKASTPTGSILLIFYYV